MGSAAQTTVPSIIPVKIPNKLASRPMLVDEEDFEFLNSFKWFLSGKPGYAYTTKKKNGKHEVAHRVILGKGTPFLIDHKDGNPLNNQKSNLRFATIQQNQWNVGCRKNNMSGKKGVYWNKENKKWHVQIRKNGKKEYLGSFSDLEKASEIYKAAALEIQGEFARF